MVMSVVAQVIAEAGGDLNIVDNNHNLALWYAVSHNRPGAVKALLRANSRTDPARDSQDVAEGGVPLKTALIRVSEDGEPQFCGWG